MDRMSLPLIEFYQPTDDAFFPTIGEVTIDRFYITGEYKPEVRVQVANYTGEDEPHKFMAYASGFNRINIKSRLSLSTEAPVTGSDISYEDAADKMRALLADMLPDIGFHEGVVNYRPESPSIVSCIELTCPADVLGKKTKIFIE